MIDEGSQISLPVPQKRHSSEPAKCQYINHTVNRKTTIYSFSANGVTSWKKLLCGYRLLRAIRRDVGATASLLESFEARSRAVNISYKAQTTQGLPT
jgi:hypothetical protein